MHDTLKKTLRFRISEELQSRIAALADKPSTRYDIVRAVLEKGLRERPRPARTHHRLPEDMIHSQEYPTPLKNVPLAMPFKMLNYDSIYIRVEADPSYMTIVPGRVTNPLPFNDGVHLPIVDMKTGHLFWMAGEKPCRPAPPFLKEPEDRIRKLYPSRSSWINEAFGRKDAGHHLFAANDEANVGFADGYDDSWHLLPRAIAEQVPTSPVRIVAWQTGDFIRNLAAVRTYLRSIGLEWMNEST